MKKRKTDVLLEERNVAISALEDIRELSGRLRSTLLGRSVLYKVHRALAKVRKLEEKR